MNKINKWDFLVHLALFLLVFLLLFANAFETLDNRARDGLYQKEREITGDIVIIGIDDESLAALGKWPWPRDYHGELISLLSKGDPAAIGYDIILAEESKDPEDDSYLVEMARQAGNVIFSVYGTFGQSADKLEGEGSLQALELTKPFPALTAATNLGHINTIMDNDGLVRKTILHIDHQGERINSLSYELYKRFVERQGGGAGGLVAISDIPLDAWARTPIVFSGQPKSFEMLPFHQVLSGEIPGEYFRDKIVLVGPTAVGLADDYYFTPIAPYTPMYGVEIHANIISQLISGTFRSEVSLLGQGLILLVMALLAYVLFSRLRPLPGVIALAVLMGALLIGARFLALGKLGYIFSFLYPLLLLGLQYIYSLAEKFVSEQLEKRRVTAVFGKYVAPQIVDKILDEGEAGLVLGGTRRDISVLFVDIRGFTPLSEAAEPEEVVSILNEYLSLCAQAIFDNGGTLDKYIGDAAMALFNAPLDLADHQLKAVMTAWAMQQGSIPLEKQLEEKFGKIIRFGVGIHTGPAIVGNIGADFRMDYTAIGDTVNTAARIESVSKPGQILISSAIYEKVKDFVEVTDIGQIEVKGKSIKLQVYQVDKLLIEKATEFVNRQER